MKSFEEGIEQQIVGVTDSKKMSIAANFKAFKELISGIYSDKAYAIARELIANAHDAHVAAGNSERPFDIHAPSSFEPHFSIRDYGVSMTKETVLTLYNTLFESTKDDPNSDFSDTQTGKFGLGSKSPFAYTDAFLVTTYLDGLQTLYDVHIHKGIPEISVLGESPTDEENGVRVEFPVEVKDIKDFARAITKACLPLEVLPNITGATLDLDKPEVILEGTNWKILKKPIEGYGGTYIKMGTVIYPFDDNAVIGAPSWLRQLNYVNLLITIPIGTAEVVTSREALSYDERTSCNLITVLTPVRKEIGKKIYSLINDEKSYAEKSNLMYNKYKYIIRNLNIFSLRSPEYKGKKIREYMRIKTSKLESDHSSIFFIDDYRQRKDRFIDYCPNKKLVILVEDTSNYLKYRANRLSLFKNNRTYSKEFVIYVKLNCNIIDAKKFINKVYVKAGRPKNYEIISLSSIEYTPPERKRNSNSNIIKYIISYKGLKSKAVKTTDVLDGFYIPTRRNGIDYNDNISIDKYIEIYREFLNLGLIDENKGIYLIGRSDRSLIKKNNLEEFRVTINNLLKNKKVMDHVIEFNFYLEYDKDQYSKDIFFYKKVSDSCHLSKFVESGIDLYNYLERVSEYRILHSCYRHFSSESQWENICNKTKQKVKAKKAELYNERNECYQRYPFLKFCSNEKVNQNINEFNAYLLLCDKAWEERQRV